MLSVTYEPFMVIAVMLNVVMHPLNSRLEYLFLFDYSTLVEKLVYSAHIENYHNQLYLKALPVISYIGHALN
jgi:hypothetical protein